MLQTQGNHLCHHNNRDNDDDNNHHAHDAHTHDAHAHDDDNHCGRASSLSVPSSDKGGQKVGSGDGWHQIKIIIIVIMLNLVRFPNPLAFGTFQVRWGPCLISLSPFCKTCFSS